MTHRKTELNARRRIIRFAVIFRAVIFNFSVTATLNSRSRELRIDFLKRMGGVRNGEQKVHKKLYSEILYGDQKLYKYLYLNCCLCF